MTFTAADDLTRLDAGQKLDIEVARIVLGTLFCNRDLNVSNPARGRSCSQYNEPEHYTRDGFHTRTHQPLPGYSTDMSAAWQLVEHLVKQGARVDLQNRATGWALHVISHGGTGREFV